MGRFLAPPVQRAGLRSGRPPSFSVVIAVYQAADLVGEAVASALEQTYPAQEIVICDDGSTDGLEQALAAFGDRIVLLRQENRGESAARNAAVRAASAEFIAVLDADDVFLPQRLEALAELASKRPDLDVLTTDAHIELDGRVVRRCYEGGFTFETADQRTGILARNFVFGLAAVRRRTYLAAGGFDEALRYAEDWDLWLRLIFSGSRIGCVAEPLARYRLQRDSLSAQRANLITGRLQVLAKARRRTDLQPHERRQLERSITDNEQLLLLARAREAVSSGGADARQRALNLAMSNSQPALTRLKAAVAVVSPGLARRVLAGRPVETTAGIRYHPEG